VLGIQFKEQETGYLVGYLAGALAKRNFTKFDGKQTISTVGGQKIPPVDHYIAGYQAGAKAADPSIKLLNGYAGDFVDQSKCKALANAQISQGSRVVFQVAGNCGLGVITAAKEKGVWAIGVDADQAYLGPQVLTSSLKRVDQAVFQLCQQVQAGQFSGGHDRLVGLKEEGVGIGKIAPGVPADILAAVKEQAAKIIAGTISVPTTVGK
jgi:basic membrane protein A